jgi:HD-GYP domain-containing protein (c-di-GMP phosphodiesterase class II)
LATTPSAADRALVSADQLRGDLEDLAERDEALGSELLRCYEQLSFVFEITEHIANFQDPAAIQNALLRRCATMLNAGALFLDHAGCCAPITCGETTGRPVEIDAERLQATLAEEIEAVRRTGRSRVANLTSATHHQIDKVHVLLGALRCRPADSHDPPGVVIALRDGREPPFDAGDPLASQAVLGYGGHILGNVLMVQDLKQTALETVCALTNAIDAKDNYTSGHSERVGWLAALTGHVLGLPAAQLQMLEWAGMLHDVGKIGVPEHILNKPGRLTAAEFEQIKLHPRLSYEVLKPVASLQPVLAAVLHHHEDYDGSGYPDGLRGVQIPLAARIIRIADTFDALTSTRPYRPSFRVERALEMLAAGSGRVTDSYLTHAFAARFRRYVREQPEDFRARFGHTVVADAQDAPPANHRC